jgi:hypothetical protein
MTRYGPEGKAYAQDGTSPAIFHASNFPFGDKTFHKLNSALEAFADLPQAKIDEYSDVQRALLQRHLWEVYDAAVAYSWRTRYLERREIVRSKVASLMRRIALTREQILALPNTVQATIKSGGFAQNHDPNDPFKPFLSADLYKKKSSWVCLGLSGRPITGIRHTEKLNSRSEFLQFMRLPSGRDETLKYQEKRLEETFPVGTQFALIEQAFLIGNEGDLILSPLIVSVQLRAFLEVERSFFLARPKATQSVAEFLMQPRELIKGNAVMKALGPNDHRYEAGDEDIQDFTSHDPFEGSRMMPKITRLNICMNCHGKAGRHSVITVGFRSRRRSLEEGDPDSIAKATAARKQSDESWKSLKQDWHAKAAK